MIHTTRPRRFAALSLFLSLSPASTRAPVARGIRRSTQGWYRVAQGGTGWYRVVQGGIGWYRMVQGGTSCASTWFWSPRALPMLSPCSPRALPTVPFWSPYGLLLPPIRLPSGPNLVPLWSPTGPLMKPPLPYDPASAAVEWVYIVDGEACMPA
eukprot:5279257-Pyramimonas_sp.AAC.2